MPAFMKRIARRTRALLRRDTVNRDLDDEVRLHLELEAEDLARTRRLTPDEARRQALIAFGGVERYKEAHRDARGVRWMDELSGDLRYALRALRRTPVFSLSAMLVLALGIGSGTAVFTAVDAVLVSRLPYPRDDRLVRIYEQNSPTNLFGTSAVDFLAIESQQRSFFAVGAARPSIAAVSVGGEPRRTAVGYATAGFFRALGVSVALGRNVEATDNRWGAPAIAVVTHAFATQNLGGDTTALGRTIHVGGAAYTVVGVMPRGVAGLTGLSAGVWPALQLAPPSRRGPFNLRIIARLTDDATPASAARDLAAISARIFPIWRSSLQDSELRLTPYPLRRVMLGDAPRTLGVLAAAVGLVLLIAVANVASLMLVRAAGRWREVSLRATLGATRGRIARLLVTESVALALAGGLAGIAVGALGLHVLVAIGPHVPRLEEARLDARAVAFALAVALLAGVVVGAYPVLHLLRGRVATLQEGERTVGGTRRATALRAAFVVAEFALALPLLAAAGLLLNSFLRLQRVDPGFDPSHVLTVSVALPTARYRSDTALATYWTRALAEVRRIPGVAGAGLGSAMPPDDPSVDENNFNLIDHPVAPGAAQPVVPWPVVSTDYFLALGVPLLDGRLFGPQDTAGAPPVVLVSRSWARHYFPDGTAVGRTLISGGCTSCPPTTVVGVVGDVKYAGLGGTADAAYDPMTQGWPTVVDLFVHTNGPPSALLARVRAALRAVEPDVALDDAAPMEDQLHAAVAQPRHITTLILALAVAALLLAAIGIFGLLSYTVSARRREIGVRVALGAPHGMVIGLIVRRGMTHAVVGAAMGLAVAVAATRGMAGALFQVSPTDPLTLGAVTALLLCVALVASWLPARRAAAIDPVEAMRSE
ncbi:MAG TPA: ADOP family duplicated permease [Gemmatimonadaceae bacterium]|jgi:predicted permease